MLAKLVWRRLLRVALGPALIRAQEHVGPVAGLGAAGAGVNGHVSGVAVEIAAEEAGDFEIIEGFFEVVEFFDHFLLGLVSGLAGRFLGSHFVQDGQVVDAGLQSAERFDQPAQAGDFFDVGLGFVFVVPEAGLGHTAFDGGQFGGEFGVVKETSAAASGGTRARRRRLFRIRDGTADNF